MNAFAVVMLAVAAPGPSAGVAAMEVPDLPTGPVELEGTPLRIAALERGSRVDVLLLRGRELEVLRLERRRLVRAGAFQAPARNSRPLLLDAAPNPGGGDPLVTAVFGEDVQSVDRGADTSLNAFVLAAGQEGDLRPLSADLGAWLRIVGGTVYSQGRGLGELASGPVRRLREASGRYLPGAEVPWAGRGLLDATPLPGGREALAWDGDRPVVVKLEGGARAPGGLILGDLGTVREPGVAIRIDRPIFRGLDREGRRKDNWTPLPRRVAVAADGGLYTVLRERSATLLGKTSGRDAVVRLDWSDRALSVSRPYPGVDAYLIDFALIDLPGRHLVTLLLVNEEEDGSGRAHLVFQEPRDDRRP